MRLFSWFFIVAAVLITPTTSGGEVPELLIPVTQQEAQQVRDKQEYFLKRYTFFAKRHRIVRVDTDVLFNEPIFRINFFDDASITVERERVGEGNMVTWKGQMRNQPVSVRELIRAGESPDAADDWYSALVDVSISAAKQVYDPETGRSGSLVKRDMKTSRPINSVNSSKGQYAFYQVSAEISPLSLKKTYRLRPLELDSRYHILYEEDPEKRITPGRFGSSPVSKADMKYRNLQYQEYLEFLGPRPTNGQ